MIFLPIPIFMQIDGIRGVFIAKKSKLFRGQKKLFRSKKLKTQYFLNFQKSLIFIQAFKRTILDGICDYILKIQSVRLRPEITAKVKKGILTSLHSFFHRILKWQTCLDYCWQLFLFLFLFY